MSKPPAIGFILMVRREPVSKPVMFITWKLGESYQNWSPCELEGLGASVAVSKCSFYILRSSLPTLLFPDNKQVIQAYNKLKEGRYSTSQRLATFTNNIMRYPIIMQHGSGKLMQNVGSDFLSRNAYECKVPSCAVCKFVKENSDSLLASIFSFGKEEGHEIILASSWSNTSNLPIGNIQAWLKIRSQDERIKEAIKFKTLGQQPPKSGKGMKEIRHYVTHCKLSSSTKLLVKEESVPFDNTSAEKIVVPRWFLKALLTQMHIDLSCPAQTQLKKTFDRYFHCHEAKDIFKQISDGCQLCQANKSVPKEIRHFSSVTKSDSPGKVFVCDVIKRSKQLIFLTRDAFSDFVTTTFIDSEKAEDLKKGIISTTSCVRGNHDIVIRVDNAPGFLSLSQQEHDNDLKRLKIELSDKINKNGLAIADKAVQE